MPIYRVVVAVFLSVVVRAGVVQGQPTGTYEFRLCHPSCLSEEADREQPVKARGMFVLVADSTELDILPASSYEELRDASVWMTGRNGFPNGCLFWAPRTSERDFYLRGTGAGLTVWSEVAEGYRVVLYQSPDAGTWITFSVSPETGQIHGTGTRRISTGRVIEDWVRVKGRRIGDADPMACR